MACASRRDWAYAHVAAFRPKAYDYGEPGTDRVTVIGRVVYYVLPVDWEI